MSDLKIIGNPNPVVGVIETYTISDFFEKMPPIQDLANTKENESVKWEIYVLENGKWRKTKENDKTGKKITYTFFEKALTRKGIRILAKKGDKIARLNIKPLSAKPKIDHIELLDKNGSQIKGHLSYGQTVKARVFCLNMEKQRVHVTLWEDDVNGKGHNKANEKNFIETLSGIVKFGKADIDFLLKPSFAKIATKNGPEKDKVHEYYVTAGLEKIASNNINVDAPEVPVRPFKAKTTPKLHAPAQQPKTDSSKENPSASPQKTKAQINSVNLTDTGDHLIKGTFKEKQIKVWINSTGLKGKKIRLKLFDDDITTAELLFQDEFTLESDLHAVVVALNSIPKNKGDDFFEGSEQELFAEVEVLQTDLFKKSTIVDVDATVFKQDPVEVTNKVMTVDEEKDDKKDDRSKLVIFPLLVKPENDIGNKWGKTRNWTAKQGANMTTFNSNRDSGRRKHAGRDLYTNSLETVVAISDGLVLEVRSFYCETNQVTIRHTLKDGRDFIIRYGELDPKSISVKAGDTVKQKQKLGETGKLLKYLKNQKKFVPLMEINDITVFMLHFEHFSGLLKFDLTKKPLSDNSKPYNRRADLTDSLAILQEGYNNTFGIQAQISKNETREFTEHDARLALMKIYDLYGRDMAKTIESIYRWEGKHFKSDQYKICGSPGMEVSGNSSAPNYGWDGSLYKKHPEYTPVGIWESFENKGKSGAGGNDQDTKNKKKYIKFPSVEAGMMYIVDFINRHNGNIGRWHSTDKKIQENYKNEIKTAIPRIVNQF